MKKGYFPAYLMRLFMDPRVSSSKKMLFPFIVIAYWILPDIMPFFPLDDLIITAIAIWLFTNSAEGDIKSEGSYNNNEGKTGKKGGGNTIDVEAKVEDDED